MCLPSGTGVCRCRDSRFTRRRASVDARGPASKPVLPRLGDRMVIRSAMSRRSDDVDSGCPHSIFATPRQRDTDLTGRCSGTVSLCEPPRGERVRVRLFGHHRAMMRADQHHRLGVPAPAHEILDRVVGAARIAADVFTLHNLVLSLQHACLRIQLHASRKFEAASAPHPRGPEQDPYLRHRSRRRGQPRPVSERYGRPRRARRWWRGCARCTRPKRDSPGR